MKLALLSDTHANFPALQAVLADIDQHGCDRIIHLGDAIAIGSQPAETLDLLLNHSTAQFVMGNHDAYFAFGIPNPRPSYMDEGEVSHHAWTREAIVAQLGESAIARVAAWPYVIQEDIEGVRVAFVHYALDESERDFASIERHPTPIILDALFAKLKANLICYGHTHRLDDLKGRKRYLNVPSLGCQATASALYTIIDVRQGDVQVEQRGVAYDDAVLLAAYDARDVPERDFLRKRFLGGR
jgi:predicted phosphodiesterase